MLYEQIPSEGLVECPSGDQDHHHIVPGDPDIEQSRPRAQSTPSSSRNGSVAISLQNFKGKGHRHAVYSDRNQLTQNLCIAGPGFSWAVSLSCIAFGGYTSRHQYTPSVNWDSLSDVLILIQTTILTLCQEVLGYIHTVSLRWNLQRDGKLDFNANLRLWQNTKRAGPNAWYGNLIVIIGQILTFGTSAMTLDREVDSGDAWLWFLGTAWVLLGVGIGMQAGIATWASLSRREWPTWSSDPVVVAAACLSQSPCSLIPRHGRSMQGLDQINQPAMSMYPARRQICAYKSHKGVRRVTWLLWMICGLCCIWTAAIFIAIAVAGSKDFSDTDFWNPFQQAPAIWIPLLGNKSNALYYIVTRDFLWMAALICMMQSVVALATHCAELHVNLSRDEAAWRQASTRKGRLGTGNALKDVFSSYQSIVLLFLKVAIQWVFSLTFSIDIYSGMGLAGAAVLYMTILVVILALFATCLVSWEPRGPQPATFGHLQTLADLIDKWPEKQDTMYWGDKGEYHDPRTGRVYDDVRHAGTSKTPLKAVRMVTEYA